MMNFITYASKGKRAAEAAPYGVVDLLSVGGLGLGGLVSLLGLLGLLGALLVDFVIYYI